MLLIPRKLSSSLGITCLQKASSFKTFTESLNIQAHCASAPGSLPARSAFICAPICIIYHAKSLSRDFTGAHLSVEIGARLFMQTSGRVLNDRRRALAHSLTQSHAQSPQKLVTPAPGAKRSSLHASHKAKLKSLFLAGRRAN